MRIFSFLLFCSLFIFSCHTGPDVSVANRLIGPDQLPGRIISINVDKDTVLATDRGTILRIPAGALDGGGSKTVQLVIKEAYSMEDIIRGGLLTQTKDGPLSSEGMLYIGAVTGESLTLKKNIDVRMPVHHLRKGLQVFKGEIDPEGKMNWINPEALPIDTGRLQALQRGRRIYETNCTSCHGLRGSLTGPALAYITERRDKKWLAGFTRDNSKMLRSGDRYSNYIFNRYNKTPMNIFPFTDREMDELYGYIRYASRGIDSNSVPDEKKAFDSAWKIAVSKGDTAMIMDTARYVTYNLDYYRFSIVSLGWHNIDILLKDLPGVKYSSLIVSIPDEFKNNVGVYLAIPSWKVFIQGGLLWNKTNEFGFYSDNGVIPLPRGVEAYILLIGEKNGQPLLGKLKWVISEKQDLSIPISPASRDDLNRELDHPYFKGLELPVVDTAQ
jgi:mono/diheme cytochrome c family protein